eukprot:g56192.t1
MFARGRRVLSVANLKSPARLAVRDAEAEKKRWWYISFGTMGLAWLAFGAWAISDEINIRKAETLPPIEKEDILSFEPAEQDTGGVTPAGAVWNNKISPKS